MGMVQLEAYALLFQGDNLLEFFDGLSTNHVNESCTTVFTDRAAKIIDVCEVIVLNERVALIGYLPNKDSVIQHLSERLLGRNITFTDISHLNHVYVGTGDAEPPKGSTVHASFFGTMYIVPISSDYEATWTPERWREYRIDEMIPFHGYEISSNVHPLACGLEQLVHVNKGCYIGREVLTRMRSRGKRGHRLEIQDNPAEGVTTLGATRSLCIVRDQ